MPSIHRPQRWLRWRNIDATADPVCPAFGHVEIVGWEHLGGQLIWWGRSSSAFERTYFDAQGVSFRYGFNNHISLAPSAVGTDGGIGLLTMDLPTWVAVDTPNPVVFGTLLGAGTYLGLNAVVAQVGSPWHLGVLDSQFYAVLSDAPLLGMNVYIVTDNGRRAFVGGLRTFLKDQNRA